MIVYDVFWNAGVAGASIDYTTAIATVSGLSYTPGALGPNRTYLFGVRARDTVTGLYERNVDVVITIITDANGNDVSKRPLAPTLLSVAPIAAGGLLVHWSYPYVATLPRPTAFRVYVGPSPVGPTYTAPAAIVPYYPGVRFYRAKITGLVGGQQYLVGVRAYNAVAEEPNTTVVSVAPVTQAPLSVAAASITGTSRA